MAEWTKARRKEQSRKLRKYHRNRKKALELDLQPIKTTLFPVPVHDGPNYATVIGQERVLDFEVKAGTDMRVTVGGYVVRVRAVP